MEEVGKKKEDTIEEKEVKKEPDYNADETSEDDDGNPEDLSGQTAKKICMSCGRLKIFVTREK